MKKNILQTMKFNASAILLTLTSLFISMAGKAQSDSLSYSTETRYDSIVEYLTPMEYAFMFHEETNWLFKSSMSTYWEYGRFAGNLKLGLEKKIAKGFSLNAALLHSSTFNLGLRPSDNGGVELSLESRWYYKNQKNIRDNKPTANLSGAYIALGAGYRRAYKVWEYEIGLKSSNPKFIPLFAKWGVQRRFLNRGFVDVGLIAGWNKSLSGNSWSSVFFNTYVDAGLAFTKDKYKLDIDKLCPVLRCHAEDQFLLKTNLLNIINLAYARKSMIGSIAPNITAELKLGRSPFSINTKVGSKLKYNNMRESGYTLFEVSPQLTMEGRYYYNLHRRMLKGKSGNGLSANYISIGPTYRGIYFNYIGNGYKLRQEYSFVGLNVGTGIQRLISEHLYLDINIGGAYGMEYSYDDKSSTGRQSNKPRVFFDLEFGVGYRF